MEKTFILEFNELEYERLIRLIQRDENHRVKNRENSRKKSGKKTNYFPIVRGPIQYKVLQILEKEIQRRTQAGNYRKCKGKRF